MIPPRCWCVVVSLMVMLVAHCGGCAGRAPILNNRYDDKEFSKADNSLHKLQYVDVIHGRVKREFLCMNIVT